MFGRRESGSNVEPIEPIDAIAPGRLDGPAITLDGIDVRRGRRLALRDVSFAIEPGTLTAVIGPNGAGKSSLFGTLSGRLRPSAGTLRVRGPVAEVLQTTDIDDQLRLTVDDVVRLGRYPTRGLLRPMRSRDRVIVREALAATEMLNLRRRPINQLSGGQRQRAFIAQGLAQQAPILLLDEPTAGLDRKSQRQVLDIMRGEADRGTTVLFATHDLDQADHADNLIVLACACICCAPPETALADPAVTRLFGPAPRWAWNDNAAASEADSAIERAAG
ncbi:MAG: metal ABC transporter ATP-binding protein [Actinomycetota bacterium]